MKLEIKLQDSYSRGELILRTLFGWLYITLPHMFILLFVGIWASILQFVAFISVLFTGRYPQSMFEFQVGLMRWQLRVQARMFNLADDYPAFGIDSTDDHVTLEVEYPEKLSRGLLLIRLFFGLIYVIIPHMFILAFLGMAVNILSFIAWWAVLFTGNYPASIHEFIVGTIRWSTRVSLYMGFMTDTYPPFSLS